MNDYTYAINSIETSIPRKK